MAKFDALAEKLVSKGGKDPKTLASVIGRKKYGNVKQKFQQLASFKERKKN